MADLGADELHLGAVEAPAQIDLDRPPTVPRTDDDATEVTGQLNGQVERLGIARQLVGQIGPIRQDDPRRVHLIRGQRRRGPQPLRPVATQRVAVERHQHRRRHLGQ